VALRQSTQKGLKAVCGDAHLLPFLSGTFDTVASLGALEHFCNPAAAVSEMSRVIKDQGHLILTIDPPGPVMFRILVAIARLWASVVRKRKVLEQPADFKISVSYVRKLLLENDLRIVFEGTYTRKVILFGRLQRYLVGIIPFRWRAAPCVHFFLCKKGKFGQVAEYGPFFPRK